MFIQHITIENFGAIRHYDIAFRQGLNIVESRYAMELHEAIAFLVCNDQVPGIPEQWLRDDLLISATICLEDTVYTVCIRSVLGRPQVFATTGMQISFLDVLSMQPLHRQPMAA